MQTATAQSREFSFSDQHFQFIKELAHRKTGIVLASNKKEMVYSRLSRRLRALKMRDFSEYCSLLAGGNAGAEMEEMVNAITTNLTSFFRENHHFEHVREVLLPEVEGRRLRLWSSACSSGMEPYSLAMTVRAAIPDIAQWDAKILATDIDSNMLSIGRAGEYQESDMENVPAACRALIQPGAKPGTVRMDGSLRQMIAFKQLNLLEGWPMQGMFDGIFCRNVVIYFDKETKHQLFSRMVERLKIGGYLYIGHSESLHDLNHRFELVGRTTYRRIA